MRVVGTAPWMICWLMDLRPLKLSGKVVKFRVLPRSFGSGIEVGSAYARGAAQERSCGDEPRMCWEGRPHVL